MKKILAFIVFTFVLLTPFPFSNLTGQPYPTPINAVTCSLEIINTPSNSGDSATVKVTLSQSGSGTVTVKLHRDTDSNIVSSTGSNNNSNIMTFTFSGSLFISGTYWFTAEINSFPCATSNTFTVTLSTSTTCKLNYVGSATLPDISYNISQKVEITNVIPNQGYNITVVGSNGSSTYGSPLLSVSNSTAPINFNIPSSAFPEPNSSYTISAKPVGPFPVCNPTISVVTGSSGSGGDNRGSGLNGIPGPNSAGSTDTAFGNISNDPAALAGRVLQIALGIAGGIAFLLMVFGSYRLIFSGGNPESVQQGREVITAAIAGLLVIVFSVFILNLIGIKIFGLNI